MKKKGHVGFDIHKKARPEVAESGGVSIIIGLSAASIFLIIFFPILMNEIIIFMLTIILAGTIGFIDDRIKLRSRYKIFLIVFTGGIMFISNYFGFIHISSPTIPVLGKLRLTLLYPFTIPLIVAVFANTVNMLEGYNGEGSGTCLIAVCSLFICGILWNSAEAIIFSIVAIAVLIPFFIFNKYPAKIFPGDVGTLSMGSMIACIALFGSLEAAVFCALLIHIFNSFYILSSVRGFFESSEIREEKEDIILLEDDRIKASSQKDAALTLPRLLLAKGPLTEPELVKNFYAISIICGIFSIITTLLMLFTVGKLELFVVFIIIGIFAAPIIILLYYFPRIRGVISLMLVLLITGILFLIFLELFIMDIPIEGLNLIIVIVPANMIIAFVLVTPAFLVWYYLTIRYFWWEINKGKKTDSLERE